MASVSFVPTVAQRYAKSPAQPKFCTDITRKAPLTPSLNACAEHCDATGLVDGVELTRVAATTSAPTTTTTLTQRKILTLSVQHTCA
jgi:hypothetical protein